jgi:hypothetical protein
MKSPLGMSGVQSVVHGGDPAVLDCLADWIPQSRKRKQMNQGTYLQRHLDPHRRRPAAGCLEDRVKRSSDAIGDAQRARLPLVLRVIVIALANYLVRQLH